MTQWQVIGTPVGPPNSRRIAPYKSPTLFEPVYDDFDNIVAVRIHLECGHVRLWRGEPPRKKDGGYKRTQRACPDCSFCRRCWQPWTEGHAKVSCDPPKDPNAIEMPW